MSWTEDYYLNKMKPQLTQAAYIPEGARQTYRDGEGASVWEYEYKQRNQPAALAFHGDKQTKPDFHFTFRSEEARQKYIKEWLEDLHERRNAQAERKIEMNAPTTLKVGDILHGSWGYDQTNCDYFQVTGRKGARGVYVRPIAQRSIPGSEGFMSETVEPIKDRFTGPETYHIASRDTIHYNPISDMLERENEEQKASGYPRERHYTAWKWDGSPNYHSWYA